VPTRTTTRDLLDRYDGVLLDIYGVMLDASGALPGAHALIAELDRRNKPYAFVSNDASRSQATYVEKFATLGLTIDGSRVVSSGSLLPGYVRGHCLAGARICVLGTSDSMDFVREGGAEVVPLVRGMEIDGIAVCDDAGFPFLDGMEWSLSALVRAIEAGRRPTLVLPNPDLLYPKGHGELGFTAGAMAMLLESGLERRFPGQRHVFDRLGKPEPHLFIAGAQRLDLPVHRIVMIGDQLETDIAGAAAAGCASALLAGGISRWNADATAEVTTDPAVTRVAPTWLLDALWP
jgi:HAD superfamily hydrolase (TIGR01450 family)